MPKVTYLLPTNTCNSYLIESIRSIDLDPFKDKSIIVVDNVCEGSSVSDFIYGLKFKTEIKIVKCMKPGVAQALNEGLRHADSEFIARLDSDDLVIPGRTERQIRALTKNKNLAALGSGAKVVNSEGKHIANLRMPAIKNLNTMRRTLRIENPYIHPSVMIRNNVLQDLKYDESAINCQDWDLWIRMCLNGMLVNNLGQNLIEYRRHANQVSSKNNSEVKSVALRRVLRNLDATLVDRYLFQRPYLETEAPTMRQLIALMAHELPQIRSFYTCRKFISALARSLNLI